MIDPISTLEKKILELENNISSLDIEKKEESSTPNCVCLNKNFSNLEIILTKRTLVSRITLNQGSSLFFQGKVQVNCSIPQEVIFALQANNTSIQKITQTLNPGENEISFFCNFVPILTEKLPIYLKIEPKEQKPVYLQNASFFIWGTTLTDDEIKYQALELETNYLISLVYFQTIYYKLVEKDSNEFVLEDLDELAEGISCCFVYSKNADKIYVLRISPNNELFFSKLGEQETFIMKGVDDVSACFQNDRIYAFIIIDNSCYTIQIDTNGNWSTPTRLNMLNLKVDKVYSYLSSGTDKIYLNMTDSTGANYLFEQISETKSSAENINATYKIDFYISGTKI